MDIITYALCKKADREIIDMIHDMEGMTVQIVDEIPTVQEAQYNVMYLVDTNGDGKYEAYIKAKISDVDQIISLGSIIDLSDFYTKSEIDTALAGKQPLLTWDNAPTSGSSNAISSGAIYTALDKIKIEEMSDTEYNALAVKDPDKVYFVYEAVEDKRTIVCTDSNGNWKYSTTIVGTTASNITDNVTAEESTVITPPTPGFDYWYGSVVFATTTPGGNKVYHSMFYFSNNGRAGMRDTASGDGAPDAYFELGTYGSITYYPTPSGSPVSGLYVFSSSHRDPGDTIKFGYNAKPNGFRRIYKGDELYATNEKPNANDISYDNITSGLISTNTQDAIDEISTYLGNQTIEMSNTEYEALAVKDPDKAYFVQGTEDNTRVVIGYDANDNPVYRMELYGCVASAAWEDNVTTAPQLIEPDNQAAGYYAIKTTIYSANDSTRYHADNLITGPAPGTAVTLTNNSSYVTDSTGTNLWFKVHTNNTYLNLMKGANSSWISNIRLNGYNVSKFGYEKIPTNIRYIYKNNKLYATINANNIVYDNSTSGLTATNVKAAIDELNANITPHEDLTQAQYDALTPVTDTTYFITDSDTDINFSDFETRLQDIEENYTLYYVDGSTRVPLTLKNTQRIIRVDDNTVDWYIINPTTNKTYKARVVATGSGNQRYNPTIAVEEWVGE